MLTNTRIVQAEYAGQEQDRRDPYSAVGQDAKAHDRVPHESQPVGGNRRNTGSSQYCAVVGGDGSGAGALDASVPYDHGAAASGAVEAGGGGEDAGWQYEEGEERYETEYDIDDAALSRSPPPLAAAATTTTAVAAEETPQPWVNPHESHEDEMTSGAHDPAKGNAIARTSSTPASYDYDIDHATAAVDENSRAPYDGEASDPNGSTIRDLMGSALFSATAEVDGGGSDGDIAAGTTGSTFRDLMGSALLVATAEGGEGGASVRHEQQQQQQQGVEEAEESDDLYDIDGQDLSSDDD